jgi:hypothetical protein
VTSLWCFQCGTEYTSGEETCTECGVGLVEEEPLAPEEVGTFEEDKLEYDLHEWSYESRRMLDQLLTGAGLAHAWQGATMVVRDVDEDAVDALVEEVEHTMLPTLDPEAERKTYAMAEWTPGQQSQLSNLLGMTGLPHEFDVNGDLVVLAEDEDEIDAFIEEVKRTTVRPLDPDAEHTVYEMAEWSTEQQARLTNMLIRAGLSHEFDDDGDLVVNARDEDAVDDVIDRLEDAIASGEPDVIHVDDDLRGNDLLSNAFDAADRIRRNTHDHEAILEFLESEVEIGRLALPYGFERDDWDRLLLDLATLRDSLESETPDDDTIVADAKRVRDALVRVI